MTNNSATEAAGWQCSGCGVASPDRHRSCNCQTNVVVRAKEQAWKIDRLSQDVAADEACQQLCRNHGFATGHGDTITDMISEIDGQIKDRIASLREQNNSWPHEVARYKAYAEKFEQENASLRERVKELGAERDQWSESLAAPLRKKVIEYAGRAVAYRARAVNAERELAREREAFQRHEQTLRDNGINSHSEAVVLVTTLRQVFDDILDELGCERDNEAALEAIASLRRERDEALAAEPTDAQIDAAAEVMWNDRDARHGGPWSGRDKREIVVIQTRATARAALRAACAITGED